MHAEVFMSKVSVSCCSVTWFSDEEDLTSSTRSPCCCCCPAGGGQEINVAVGCTVEGAVGCSTVACTQRQRHTILLQNESQIAFNLVMDISPHGSIVHPVWGIHGQYLTLLVEPETT